MNARTNIWTKTLLGSLVVVGGLTGTASAAQPPIAQPRPFPNNIGQPRPQPMPIQPIRPNPLPLPNQQRIQPIQPIRPNPLPTPNYPRIQPVQPIRPNPLPTPIQPRPLPIDPHCHRHSCLPPWWWWQQNYPYPYPVVTPIFVPQSVPVQSPIPDQPRVVQNKIQMVVPNAKAEVALDGKVISGLGMNRWIDTPNQTEGQTYSYQITVRWDNDGEPKSETRTVTVTAGRYGYVDFTRPQAS